MKYIYNKDTKLHRDMNDCRTEIEKEEEVPCEMEKKRISAIDYRRR